MSKRKSHPSFIQPATPEQDQTPLTREVALARLGSPTMVKNIPGLGNVVYRHLSFEDHYKLQAYTGDNAEFVARVIVAGIVEPKFLEEDIPALKAGKFGPISKLGHLPLEDTSKGPIKDDELGK